MYLLGIAIDGGKYAVINSKTSGSGIIIRLKTLSAGQRSAVLNFYLKKKNTFVHVKTEKLEGLYCKENSPAEITLNVKYSFLGWVIKVSSRGIETFTVKIAAVNRLKLLLAAAVLSVVSAVLFLVFKPAGFFNEIFTESTPVSDSAENISMKEKAEKETVPELIETAGTADSSSFDPSAAPAADKVFSGGKNENTEKEETEKKVFNTTVYFMPDSSVLTNAAENALNQLAGNVNTFLNFSPDSTSGKNTDAGAEIVLKSEGHCAEYGTESGRIKLSEKRASAAAEYIAGFLPENILITIKGYGSSRPVSSDADKQNLNRRAEITVSVQL